MRLSIPLHKIINLLTFSPFGVCLDYFIHVAHVFKPLTLVLSDLIWITSLVSAEQFIVITHLK